MENKKINELNDEALDSVTGGAYYQYNEKTGEYEVFNKDGIMIFSFADERSAKCIADSRSVIESIRDSQRPKAPWE